MYTLLLNCYQLGLVFVKICQIFHANQYLFQRKTDLVFYYELHLECFSN